MDAPLMVSGTRMFTSDGVALAIALNALVERVEALEQQVAELKGEQR